MERTHTDWMQVGLIFCLGLFAAMQFGKVSLTLVEVGSLYGRSATAVAYLVSMVGSVGMIFGVIAGAVVANLGARRALLGAIVFGGALSLLQALIPPLWGMTALRIAEGFSHLTIVVAAPALMAAAANAKDRPVAMSLWAMFFGVAFALAAGLLPWLLKLGGVPLVFVLHGLGLWLIGAVLALRLPHVPGVPATIRFFQAHTESYGRARTAAPGLGFVFYTLVYIALLTFLPERLGRAGLGQSLPIISLFGTFAAGWVARIRRPDSIAAIGFVTTILCGVLAAFGQVWAIYPLFFCLGLIPGACFAGIPHFNPDPADQVRASGALAQMGNVGTTLGTPMFAVALAAGGLSGLWLFLIVACCAGLALVVWMTWLITRQD